MVWLRHVEPCSRRRNSLPSVVRAYRRRECVLTGRGCLCVLARNSEPELEFSQIGETVIELDKVTGARPWDARVRVRLFFVLPWYYAAWKIAGFFIGGVANKKKLNENGDYDWRPRGSTAAMESALSIAGENLSRVARVVIFLELFS